MKPHSNSFENSSMNLFGSWTKICICRWCPSDIRWHLKPFSSLHCFWHIWQYHLSFMSPLALSLFPSHLIEPTSCFGIVVQRRNVPTGLVLYGSAARMNWHAHPMLK